MYMCMRRGAKREIKEREREEGGKYKTYLEMRLLGHFWLKLFSKRKNISCTESKNQIEMEMFFKKKKKTKKRGREKVLC